ncbi:hypothetical protein [Arundinibacter roseus]|uniref:Beta-lactamase-inhibitor-like PepSY-like domain-containing protein n=1 Tax=Arundinibacter roseus TaxID=2070510 RepID=A0A4R4K7N5_9BACT|nr:hypothetical protein [Arundinibacter roseus]TDB63627.1 hypothetical protein EZE20_15090 [Arundinibacter roseus]
MKKTILIAAFVVAGLGVSAQTTSPTQSPTTNPTQSPTQTQSQNMNVGRDYSSTTFDQVPQGLRTSFGQTYSSVSDAKWERNNAGYRTSFQQDGRDVSIRYDLQGKEQEMRRGIEMNALPASVRSSLKGQEANYPYEVKVGNQTFYSTQVGGKEMYFDKSGKSVQPPKID